ncbi:hypothetical protein B0H13DRAFT_1877970 [Mycena leptocephala]|nr:hypothetical protein B0H13DRAFT_1877970 [Mycena leptocephala]
MSSSLEDQLTGLSLTDLTLSRSPSPASSLSSSDGSTEYFSDDGEESPHTPPRTPPPPPRTPTRPSAGQQRLPTDHPNSRASATRLYVFNSPSEHGLTPEWPKPLMLPSGSQMRLPNDSPRALATRITMERTPYFSGQFQAYIPGVQNVSGALFQGYRTLRDAQAAYEYAQTKSWTGVCSLTSTRTPSSRILRHKMPRPVADEATPNPLHRGKWYIVYKGVEPGVYLSSLECGLHTTGLSGSTYDSTDDESTARARFVTASENGRTSCIPHTCNVELPP